MVCGVLFIPLKNVFKGKTYRLSLSAYSFSCSPFSIREHVATRSYNYRNLA